ncbi:uncharacterized protein JCM6883_003805 [Sporobolomyces salmoneus]|uniref:uncharacterized protein n=1 Tax=Sporobolomyces salmoneus TaxID=183962 RepID=UPI00317FAB00
MELASNLSSTRIDHATTPSLPPELLSEITKYAAQYGSTFDSYKERLRKLSSLSLANQTFRELAQPLLAHKVYLTPEASVKILQGDVAESVKSLAYDQESGWPEWRQIPFSARFVNLTELRVQRQYLDLLPLGGYQNLARLAFEECHLAGWSNLVLPGLVELSLDEVTIFPSTEAPQKVLADFLSTSHFPSLRVLGTRSTRLERFMWDRILIDYSLACQLDCIVSNQVYDIHRRLADDHPLSFPTPFGYPGPFLFDLSHLRSFHTIISSIRTAGSPDPLFSRTHVRIRLPCKPTPVRSAVKSAFCLAECLLGHSTALKELYLDFYPRDGPSDYELDQDLEGRITKLEDQAREKKVEIIWETHEDDWCKSFVSKEFWRRSKEKKQRQEETNEA